MQNERKLLNLILASAAIFYLVFIFRTSFVVRGQCYFTLVDDAMISMRYACHLAEGHGLVWNIGQPPVEGFTNLGWTLVLAFIHLFPLPQPYVSLTAMGIAAAILLANILVVYQIVRTLDPSAFGVP